MCYSDKAATVRHLGLYGNLSQYSGESLMLLADVQHALLPLSSHHWYSQTFRVKDCARNPPTLQSELRTLASRSITIDIVSSCYEEGSQGSDLRIRAIHISHVIRAVSSKDIAPRRSYTEPYTNKIVQVSDKHERCNGVS
jgi:hypothetical protein